MTCEQQSRIRPAPPPEPPAPSQGLTPASYREGVLYSGLWEKTAFLPGEGMQIMGGFSGFLDVQTLLKPTQTKNVPSLTRACFFYSSLCPIGDFVFPPISGLRTGLQVEPPELRGEAGCPVAWSLPVTGGCQESSARRDFSLRAAWPSWRAPTHRRERNPSFDEIPEGRFIPDLVSHSPNESAMLLVNPPPENDLNT